MCAGPRATALEARIPNSAQIPFSLTVYFTPFGDLLLKGAEKVWMQAAQGPLSCTDPSGLPRQGRGSRWRGAQTWRGLFQGGREDPCPPYFSSARNLGCG